MPSMCSHTLPTETLNGGHPERPAFAYVPPPPPAKTFSPLEDVRRVIASKDPIAPIIKETYEVILEALRRYRTDGLALSFNGGKDCTVLLHLLYAARQQYEAENQSGPIHINTLYVAHTDSFPEVDEFVEFCERRYTMDLMKIYGPMKEGIRNFLEFHPQTKAMLVGTRRTDPFGEKLEPFQMTDPGWPPIMRVHPILDWDYTAIWRGMELLHVPYCILYDEGYTSLGGVDNTQRNPALRNDSDGYDPAYKLTDGTRERDGRIRKL
ncbi:uncharacterized protein EV422DRAFT_540434 [Fimicolochytrium jonesii]|uniref:uncharacterized protein n=1 Tax=Fimicolochytrium jonesii TaxID=1396493 RepID=UPI0022FE8089|nr:uncharacterized protein EV422DRAFT_540434 [Fimicolochytrium jonesii]KAI8817651.1 hypothetical protein EV422DRAFT_540434 [Fimicolochytrium jonesii]